MFEKIKERIKAFFRKEESVEAAIENIEEKHKLLRGLTRNAGIQSDPVKEEEIFLNLEATRSAAKYYDIQNELGRRQLRLMNSQKRYTNAIIAATWIMALFAILSFWKSCANDAPKKHSHKVEWRSWRHHWR